MMFDWESGRQNSGYDKIKLLESKRFFKFDVYLLKFPVGSKIAPHIDTVDDGNHYRLNIILKKAKAGGEFICKNPIFETNRIKLFRPDISEHQVTSIIKGTRYLLSIGWLCSA